ncbi:MAG: S41 family peptidase [Defluviitaleaceae bacterium]|nr:S41 family peptidase [Defluviitaleaceae bacterium]MCL2835665.1 S41 family peptidase [Defluviitaleaceae bacterium]
MENKKNYVIGVFTGMIVMVAAYIAVMLFFPDVLSGNNGQASGGRFSERNTAAATPPPVYPSAGVKLDDIMYLMDRFYVEHIDMDDFTNRIFREVVNLVNDPYTVYMDPKQHKDFMEDTEGVYTGIGVVVNGNTSTNRIIVISPFEGSPGAKAGIHPGDAIIKVNGYDVTADKLHEAIDMIKGEPGTSVDITIYRESTDETLELNIVREVITVPTVSHRMLENDIGYLRITQFERVTLDQFNHAYSDLTENGMKGLILDLRNNPGGLLTVVTQITDVLVPEGIIVYTEDKRGRQVITPSGSDHIQIPMLILVNGASASASEVLSGAVRDHGVGELVGTTTFGKGLVQNLYPLQDNSALKITVAKYYTPSGICIQDTGLSPDYEIDMDTELSMRLSQLTLDEDVQLKRAIEIMNEKLGIQSR